MASSSITDLAEVISTNTAIINNYLNSHKLDLPSFDVDAPGTSLIPNDAPEVEAARNAVIDATLKLHDLILGPKEYLMNFTVSSSPSDTYVHVL